MFRMILFIGGCFVGILLLSYLIWNLGRELHWKYSYMEKNTELIHKMVRPECLMHNLPKESPEKIEKVFQESVEEKR